MDHRNYTLILPLLLLAGCDMTVDVDGLLGNTEKLTGALTHYMDGGTIELFGNPGTHCLGNFDYSRSRRATEGRGMLICDDRRSGRFRFTLSGMKHGAGSGSLNGQNYSFTF